MHDQFVRHRPGHVGAQILFHHAQRHVQRGCHACRRPDGTVDDKASGIGRALAEAFHQRGNQVIIAGRRQALLDEIARANPGIDTVQLDINDPQQIKAVAQKVIEEEI
jgi:hypothetical protein